VHAGPRTRKIAAVLCVALLVFAAVVPGVAATFLSPILTPLWLVVPAVGVVVIGRRASASDEQSVALISLANFRAPPASRLPA
jgi:hypothetical protein